MDGEREGGVNWGIRPRGRPPTVYWGQIPIVLMFREPSDYLLVSGVCFFQREVNYRVEEEI